MSVTRTGKFGIGFRRIGGDWQKDVSNTIEFAKAQGFTSIEWASDPPALKQIRDAGLTLGAVDFPGFGGKGLISSDAREREQAVAQSTEQVHACIEAGAKIFFLVMLPKDPSLPRNENFAYMIESFMPIAQVLEDGGAKLVIEGWPGAGSLVCTPETYRAFFESVESPTMGVNYDPSHLMRMGIDPIRFLGEFKDRVYHVHAKDTEIDPEQLYQLGHEMPATYAVGPGFGTPTWRYTIPGHGQMRWTAALKILEQAGYRGEVSIELEDANFNGSEESEKLGLVKSRQFLEGC